MVGHRAERGKFFHCSRTISKSRGGGITIEGEAREKNLVGLVDVGKVAEVLGKHVQSLIF